MSVQRATRSNPVVPAPRPKSSVIVSGKVIYRKALAGIGGEAPPGGYFLKLAKPIEYKGVKTTELRLTGVERDFEASIKELVGKTFSTSGTLSVKKWGGVETRGGSYLELRAAAG